MPVRLVGSPLFTVGTVLFAAASTRTATFGLVATAVIGGALVVFGLGRLVPVGVVQFYVQSAAALLALLPLAVAIGVGRPGAPIR
ncbi:hypothetical protein [Streptomyces vilmorinianum]|uniref:hypothetical protein n=1 Tax=Streptomyces vilmorinianum TaxID=3051092 RepID=UPI0010FB8E51|nr:hypothetical protein [Streptomyces vilmorinianum]